MTPDKLLQFIAEVSERSYRRGAQQAVALNMNESKLAQWRFNTPVRRALGLDGFETTSLKRLMIEERARLNVAGLLDDSHA